MPRTVSGQTPCPQTSGHGFELLNVRRRVLRTQTKWGLGGRAREKGAPVWQGTKTRPLLALRVCGRDFPCLWEQMRWVLPLGVPPHLPAAREGREGAEKSARRAVPEEGSSWPGMGSPHHGAQGMGLGLGHHLATPLPVIPGSKGNGGGVVGTRNLHPRWHRGPTLEDFCHIWSAIRTWANSP